jgi:uncharacterized protein (UPF0332 family)
VTGLWAKAVEASKSARLLYEHGDANGAANRAYYSMFNAARTALARLDPSLARTKRHATIIGRFSRYIVRQRGIDPDMGREFNVAFELRMIADYESEGLEMEDARGLVKSAASFLSAVENSMLRTDL